MSLTINPFDLLGDEGDGGRRRRAPQPKPAAPAPTPAVTAKPAAAPVAKPPPQQQPADKQKSSNAKAAPNAAPAKKENGAPKPKPQQSGDALKGKGERRAPPQQQQQQQQAGGYAPPAPRNTGDEGFGGQTKRHEERRERAPGRGRKFDRKSGTGRPPTENKRSGSGKANWGKIGENEEEIAKENGETEKEETDKPAEGEVAPAAEGEAAPKEPELKGLDEYLETLKSKAAKVEAPKRREAGEGVDQSAWKEYVPLSKEDGGEVAPLKLKKKDMAPKEAPKKETDASAEVLNFHLAPPQGIEERGGRRGGRGGGRGGDRKGRGGDRGGRGGRQGGRGRGGQHADNGQAVFGAEDFPVLGGSGGVAPAAAAKPAAAPSQAPVAAPAAATATAPAPVKA